MFSTTNFRRLTFKPEFLIIINSVQCYTLHPFYKTRFREKQSSQIITMTFAHSNTFNSFYLLILSVESIHCKKGYRVSRSGDRKTVNLFYSAGWSLSTRPSPGGRGRWRGGGLLATSRNRQTPTHRPNI